MKTGMIIKIAAVLSGASFIVSCSSGSSNQSAQTFQSGTAAPIIGGSNSTLDYQKQNGIVGVLMIYQDQMGQQMSAGCTSSLITKNVVVTAAHCLVAPKGAKLVQAVVYFSNDLSTVMDEISNGNKSNVRPIDKVLRHEAYLQSEQSNNDIGLIHFAGTTPEGFQLATRATHESAAAMKPGSSVTLAGFGVSDYKKDSKTGKLSGEGSGFLRQIDNIEVVSFSASGEEMTFDQSKGSGACHGDSGGPAYFLVQATQKPRLVTPTSSGFWVA